MYNVIRTFVQNVGLRQRRGKLIVNEIIEQLNNLTKEELHIILEQIRKSLKEEPA